MATTKKIKKPVKKVVKNEPVTPRDAEVLMGMLKKVSDDATAKINDLRDKFNNVDADTKKKIITGLSVIAGGLVVLAGASKIKSNKKKKASK